MTKNIFPQFLSDAISTNFADVCATGTMMEIHEVSQLLNEDSHNSTIKNFLSSEELTKLHTFEMQKRKKEWLAGRICAKKAATRFLLLQKNGTVQRNQIVIKNDSSGRPYICWPDSYKLKKQCDISISHSSRFAMALIAETACGIDVQQPKQTLHRVKERFCLTEEETLLKKHLEKEDELHSLALLWTAKEAIRKASSLNFVPEFRQLKLISLTQEGDQWWQMTFYHPDIAPTVICGLYEDYGMAICITRELSHA